MIEQKSKESFTIAVFPFHFIMAVRLIAHIQLLQEIE